MPCASYQPEGFQLSVRAKARDSAAVPATALSDAHSRRAMAVSDICTTPRLAEVSEETSPKPHSVCVWEEYTAP